MTNIEKVKMFMTATGQHLPNKIDFDVETVKLRLALLKEELQEFEEACKTYNTIEALDGLIDLEYILHGTILSMGFEKYFQKGFDLVHDNNMTKVCKTIEEANESVLYHKLKGVECEVKQIDDHLVIIRNDGKLLKPYNYKKVNLEQVIWN